MVLFTHSLALSHVMALVCMCMLQGVYDGVYILFQVWLRSFKRGG